MLNSDAYPGGFHRLSVSCFYASLFVLFILISFLLMGIFSLIVNLISPEVNARSIQLSNFLVGAALVFYEVAKPYIFGIALMLLLFWLGWIFAGFANTEQKI